MSKLILFLGSTLFLLSINTLQSQVAGLRGWTIYIDPGHSQKENMGLYGYSEAEKVLRVALALREILQSQTDIDTVYMSRTDDQQSVSLTQRTNYANSVAAHFYYSIHSDAGSTSANSTLLLHGGWREAGQTMEKTPQGGKKMGDLVALELTAGMRIPTRGNYADRTFYEGFPFEHTNKWPYLHVNRESFMASVLSEAGFHTNPTQQQRNMNAQWKRLEAQSAFWSILQYNNIARPPVGIATGFITDVETGLAINGATITLAESSYTTDTYGTLFHNYSNNPDGLRNGFYYVETLPVAQTLDLMLTANGFYPETTSVTIRTDNFTFLDLQMHSSLPPYVVSSTPVNGSTGILPNASITLNLSRPLLRSTAESNIYLLDPNGARVAGTFSWPGSQTVSFKPGSILLMDTTFAFIVGSQVQDMYGHSFDGNGDGTPGDSLIITFRTRTADVTAPATISVFPGDNAVLRSENHIINVTFNEPLNPATVNASSVALFEIGTSLIPLTLRYVEANGRGGINAYPSPALKPGKSYMLRVGGVADMSGNAIPTASPLLWQFSLAPSSHNFQVIDDMNSPIANWWQPSASGSTVGYDSTSFGVDSLVTIPTLSQNTGSGLLRYFWRTSASDWFLREYLGGGPPRAMTWRNEKTKLQVYIYGDASGTLFRFAVDDSVDAFPSGQTVNHEVSLWTKIDWVGWRLIEWDLSNDSVGTWLGNGKLEGLLRFDSFQLTYQPGISSSSGQLRFDQLQLAQAVVTTVHEDLSVLPKSITLYQNYPNPFNPATTIKYEIEKQGFTLLVIHDVLGRQIRTLVSSVQMPGSYGVVWDGSDDHGTKVSSGLYLLRLQHESSVLTQKMILMK